MKYTVKSGRKPRTAGSLDVALEALQEAWEGRRIGIDELWRYAQISRVANVMRPYTELLASR